MIPLLNSFEQHSNGLATISLDSHVSQDSYANSNSIISGQSAVINSSLIDSKAHDSVILNSRVLGSVLTATVAADTSIRESKLEDCVIAGLFGKAPDISGVHLRNCTIEGGARLIGPWTLDAAARVHEGAWYRAPRFRTLSSANGVIVTLTECVDGRALIACRCHDMRRWQTSGPRLGRMLGWPAELVREAWLTFEEWLDDPQAAVIQTGLHNQGSKYTIPA